MKFQINIFLLMLYPIVACYGQKIKHGLRVSLLESVDKNHSVASYEGCDKGGNTSIGFDTHFKIKYSGTSNDKSASFGYFDKLGNEIAYMKRDRDLGQTFKINGNQIVKLSSITIRIGFGTNAVRKNAYGNNLSIQIFEVSGQGVLNDNDTNEGQNALHGYPHDPTKGIPHERDDYFEGEKYKSLAIFSGGKFPSKSDFGFDENQDIDHNHEKLKGKYLRFDLPTEKIIKLKPGKTYAFLIMMDKPCADCGFTLANNFYGEYEKGHGIRREGSGKFPPTPANPNFDVYHPSNYNALKDAHFPNKFKKRTKIAPGTNGYPDVDTHRDFVFYIN